VVVDSAEALEAHVSAWQDLAAQALEPNPFYEPWMLMPALRAFGKGQDLLFVFLYRDTPGAKARLCGFFPLHRRRLKKISLLGLWQHQHCFLCTPLLRKEDAVECLAAVVDWARRDRRGASILEFNQVSAEGGFHRSWIDFLQRHECFTFLQACHTRALWQPRADVDTYVNLALSSSGRQDFRRKRKRLGELGRLEFRSLEIGGDVERWLTQFLEVEASGWKGDQQTALAKIPEEREYFLEIGRAAFARGQLQMLGLFLDDKPIALKCNFLSGAGAFVFKPAYDESFARYSPGALLELDNMQLCHRSSPVPWMDSCTEPDHPLWNRLWMDRRPIQTILLSTGGTWGNLLVSLRPLLRWFGTWLRRKRPTSGQPAPS
jgi:CelD/BcsL family acetyltransferase involved in cellulose biosynthesis